MVALQITLHTLRAKHAAVERKLLPWLEADDAVVAHLELNTALLAAEAAMSFDQRLADGLRFFLPAARRCVIQMRPELTAVSAFDGCGRLATGFSFKLSWARGKRSCAYRPDTIPASCPLGRRHV